MGFLGLSVILVLYPGDSWAVVSPCLSPQSSCLAVVLPDQFLCQGRGFSLEARVPFRMALILALQKPGMVVQSCSPS